eukprot:TRINITY_DN25271_c0_g1_i1.p1 TRINITY_DN25271_c0_g1~~TRINITY_DN25271_c0_g1_i1.p1  ORF type:complete len:419 (-),score=82.95 TRINITY_DN25271_c0_g1_i1:178-1434(-)
MKASSEDASKSKSPSKASSKDASKSKAGRKASPKGKRNSSKDDKKKAKQSEAQNADKKVSNPAQLKAYFEVKDTYGRVSAKARGDTLHNGPLKLRRSLAPRDCTSWVREDKQYNPYSYFESPANKATPVPPKSKGPPPLWLLPHDKDGRVKAKSQPASPSGHQGSSKKSGSGKSGGLLGVNQQKPWDTEHHIMVSRMNSEVQVGVREYFDVPKRKESEGIPKMRERYVMNDRQAGWNDEPDEPGLGRRTLYNNCGPYNVGGCKQQQLPSWWRKIKDWGSYSYPELPSHALSGSKNYSNDKTAEEKAMLYALANAPPGKSAEFWRGWANEHNNFAKEVKQELETDLKTRLQPWDNAWNITYSKGNDEVNPRDREYFSVSGGIGRMTPGPRTPSSIKTNPLGLTFAEGMRSLRLNETAHG